MNNAQPTRMFSLRKRMFNTRLLIFSVMLIMLFAKPFILPESALHEAMIGTGYFFVIACVLGRIYCSIFISRLKNKQLIDIGPYSVVRNPLYAFSFIGTLGLVLQTGFVSIAILTILLFCLYYPYIVKSEESKLVRKFGQEYLNYLERVPRWIPRTFKMKLPDNVQACPAVIATSIRDAALFFLAIPCFKLFEHLHAWHIVPTWFSLY